MDDETFGEEEEVMPGVYLSKFRGSSSKHRVRSASASSGDSIEVREGFSGGGINPNKSMSTVPGTGKDATPEQPTMEFVEEDEVPLLRQRLAALEVSQSELLKYDAKLDDSVLKEAYSENTLIMSRIREKLSILAPSGVC